MQQNTLPWIGFVLHLPLLSLTANFSIGLTQAVRGLGVLGGGFFAQAEFHDDYEDKPLLV